MTITERSRMLASQRVQETQLVNRAIEIATEIFEAHAGGITESELIHLVKERTGVSLPLAVAAVDCFETDGAVLKDWSNGSLSRP